MPHLTATVTDDWNESRTVTRTASVSPDIIVLHPKLNVETVREYPIDSLYTMMPYVNLKVVAGQAVPTAVTDNGRRTLHGTLHRLSR